ncbi:hypothetical protein M422DRAFT_54045 [Sphaerobolus stellatus SS14]|uniref:Unplaced genomic scaffold SPHSTscaffold_361, whole genome shotgun sequence n=1 Tax=Sphaerobolus stellatus (strain SS14) TaxID=990650 RepID=A0A0C9UWJ0_SPHS4|nr:hypothetical protein M422DRAFT_56143 [Sphaerobolus stellatus SS14]KIJ29691.1 hypothetical protein M422DRAFT_54045 [Sphaerobolus stellatus SS14]
MDSEVFLVAFEMGEQHQPTHPEPWPLTPGCVKGKLVPNDEIRMKVWKGWLNETSSSAAKVAKNSKDPLWLGHPINRTKCKREDEQGNSKKEANQRLNVIN